jgi:hypothetical protein
MAISPLMIWRTTLFLLLCCRAATAQESSAAEKAAASAIASQPAITATRGGSLGLPGGAGNSVSALLNNRIATTGADKKYSADFFARIGQLSFSWFNVEVLGESSSLDIPVVTSSPSSLAMGARPLPLLQSQTFAQIGARVTIRRPFDEGRYLRWLPGATVDTPHKFEKFVSKCITARNVMMPQANEASCGNDRVCVAAMRVAAVFSYDQDTAKEFVGACETLRVSMLTKGNESDISARTLSAEYKLSGWSGTAGIRALYSATGDVGQTSGGVAGEAGAQYLSSNFGWFASLSSLYVTGDKTTTGDTIIQRQGITEARVALGFHYQRSWTPFNTEFLPRVGLFVAYTRNFWNNMFAAQGTEAKISGNQVEFALYVSGHFSSGFSGLIALSMLKPYGAESDIKWFISLAPVFGASTGK